MLTPSSNMTETNYTQSDLGAAHTAAGLPRTIESLVNAQKRWHFANLRAPGVDVECAWGEKDSEPVPRSYVFEEGLEKEPRVETTDAGDGIVNVASLRKCLEWKEKGRGGLQKGG